MKYLRSLTTIPLALVATSSAAVTMHTTQDSFLSAIADPYLESFDGLSTGPAFAMQSFASPPYAYEATQTGSGYFIISNTSDPADVWLSSNGTTNTFTFTFANSNVYGVGGNFFATTNLGAFQNGGIQLQVDGGSPEVINPTSPGSFIGFVSDSPINTLTVSPTVQGVYYLTMNDFIVGDAIPEPSSTIITATLLTSGMALRRRVNSSSRQ